MNLMWSILHDDRGDCNRTLFPTLTYSSKLTSPGRRIASVIRRVANCANVSTCLKLEGTHDTHAVSREVIRTET